MSDEKEQEYLRKIAKLELIIRSYVAKEEARKTKARERQLVYREKQ